VSPRRDLCPAAEVAEGAGKGFVFGAGTARRDLFVVRWRGRVLGYENRCPHAGTPLDGLPDRFFDADGAHLLCGTHGALFEVETGLCVKGPCRGRSLTPLVVVEEAGRICLVEEDPAAHTP